MPSSRADADYSLLRNRIRLELRKAAETLRNMGYRVERISSKELYDYLTGETPTGDKITIHDILSDEYLVLHEAVEISELKKKGVSINKHTVMRCLRRVYEAHYTATEHEFNHALSKKDFNWVKLRLAHARGWLDDPYLPKELIKRCESLIREYSKRLVVE